MPAKSRTPHPSAPDPVKMQVSVDALAKVVRIDFGQSVTWVATDAEGAAAFAKALAKAAHALHNIITKDTMH